MSIKFLIYALSTACLFYCFVVLLAYIMQDHLIYFPSTVIHSTPSNRSMAFEEVSFSSEDGNTLFGWYIAAPNATDTLLFCHGNAGNISDRLDSIAIFHRLGLNVFIFDYQGYGKSKGIPTELGTFYDGKGAWDYLISIKHCSPENIILFGRSLGGPIAAKIAQDHHPKGLILESTFSSMPTLAKETYPYLPIKGLFKYKYRTATFIQNNRSPVLIIHSKNDELISYRHAETLYDLARMPKSLLSIQGKHNDGFITDASYETGLNTFLTSLEKD